MHDELRIPQIETERLLLRGWRDDDLAPMTAINSDPAVNGWLSPMDPSMTASRIAAWIDHWRRHGFGLWAVEERESGRFVGRIGLMHHDDWTASPHDAEVGWTLASDVWDWATRQKVDARRSTGRVHVETRGRSSRSRALTTCARGESWRSSARFTRARRSGTVPTRCGTRPS